MNHQRNLSEFAEELVHLYGKYEGDQYELFLDMLPEHEQNELVRLYIEATNRETNECVYGDDFTIESDFTCALLAMLKDDCHDTREHFAAVTRKNMLTYYKKSLDEVLMTACNSYLFQNMNEAGYYASIDEEHGDVVWGRF